ncbi:MAG: hypothetical protein IKO19_13430, partial [Candidatus Riflebacteria bacterium]|nr:hypothetical protein [Candidatus Riflebacteria bacterium]
IIKIENKLKEAKLNDSELAVIYLALGNIYFTSNNISKAENYFNKFLNTDTVRNIIQTHENLKNLRNDLLSKVERSRKYDELAKKYFTLSLKESHVLKKGITSCNYILGELDRSLGNFDNAEKYYQEVINESDIDKKILENINFVFNNFLKKESKELNKKQALKEEQNIKEIFQNINNDPMKLLSASETLKNSNRRDLIFPKLKEFIKSGNDDLIEAAVYSMSDHTQEAVDLQVSLLKSGKCINAVLTNLRFSSDLIKKSDDNVFINIFNKDATPSWNITSYLAALDTENCRKAIIDKANKMFSKDELLALSKYDGENTALSGAHTAVLNALALIQSRESIMTLLKTLTAVKDIKSDSRMITNIKSSIGYAVEITFNRPFGFTRTTSNRPYGKYPLVIEDKTFEQAYTEFVNWYQQIHSSGKTIAQIITEGFKPLGYNIEPIDSIDALNELITGLTDSFNPVRINCYKELVKRTGIMHRACNNYEEIGFNNDYTKTYYSDWLKENKEKLKFDKNKHKFIISK